MNAPPCRRMRRHVARPWRQHVLRCAVSVNCPPSVKVPTPCYTGCMKAPAPWYQLYESANQIDILSSTVLSTPTKQIHRAYKGTCALVHQVHEGTKLVDLYYFCSIHSIVFVPHLIKYLHMYPALSGICEIKQTSGRGQRDSQRKPHDCLTPTRDSYARILNFVLKVKLIKTGQLTTWTRSENRSIDNMDPYLKLYMGEIGQNGYLHVSMSV